MISTDSPIQKKGKEDVLKRAPLAEKVAQLIKRYKGKESYVIGIEGIWGAGKTSFINLVLENFKANDAVIVKFNPWNFANQNELIADFFDSFLAGVNNSDEDSEIKETLAAYSKKLLKQTEFEFSPSFSVFGAANFSLGKVKKVGGIPTLSEMRKNIDTLLHRRSKKILVVIDDIDRLDRQETLLILKMVKMTANFPNTVFLLAYDREKVAERITEQGIGGEDYLKKIVQVSFTLPVPDKQNLRGVLFSGLDATLNTVYGGYTFNQEEQKHWEAVFHHGLGDLFITIRDINRFLSSLQLNWSVINKEDVNPVDFIAVEALRIFVPTYYNVLAGNKALFLNRDDSSLNFRTNEKDEERKKLYQEILDNEKIVPKLLKKQVDGISRELFPQLDIRISNGSDSERIWRREQRICAEQKFDFYFQLSVPEDEVSEVEVQTLLSTTIDETSLRERFLALDKEKKLTKAIDLILDRREEVNENQAEALLSCLWSLDGQVEDKKTGLFELSDFGTIVARLTYQLIAHAIPKEKRQDLILRIMEKTQNLHFPIRLFGVFEEQIEKNDSDMPVEKSFVPVLKQKILAAIKEKANNGNLAGETRFDVVLFRWSDWENKKVVEKYIGELITSDKGLLQLLEGFTGTVYSSNQGAYRTIGNEALGKLYPIEKIQARVKELKKKKDSKMSVPDKELIHLFENPPKTW